MKKMIILKLKRYRKNLQNLRDLTNEWKETLKWFLRRRTEILWSFSRKCSKWINPCNLCTWTTFKWSTAKLNKSTAKQNVSKSLNPKPFPPTSSPLEFSSSKQSFLNQSQNSIGSRNVAKDKNKSLRSLIYLI